MVGVVSLVGEQAAERIGGAHQGRGHADIVDVSGAEQQHARPSAVVDQAVELGRPAASGAADGLVEGPPFAPAAERCALTWVASIAAPSKIAAMTVRASNICSQMPCRLQRLKRL